VPLVVQLCDEMGNATAEADVKVVLIADKGIKVITELYLTLKFFIFKDSIKLLTWY
jgi:hypothetical protein